MATLDELENMQFQPLDINTPIVDRAGMPTPVFKRHQQAFSKIISATATGAAAAIRQEGEVRAEADNASAILVDAATAEALGFTAAILMKAEVGINPGGVLARYQIVASLDPGGALVQTGMMFDIVSDGAGGYLGQIILDADKVKIGRADTTGTFPFFLEGDTLYIENAVIKNLTIGTNKLAYNAATSIVMTGATGVLPPGAILAEAVIFNEFGTISMDFSSFLNRPSPDGANFGDLGILVFRNGVGITGRTMFYDDNFAYPVSFIHIDSPPSGASYLYQVTSTIYSGSGNLSFKDSILRLINFKR